MPLKIYISSRDFPGDPLATTQCLQGRESVEFRKLNPMCYSEDPAQLNTHTHTHI